MRRHQKGVSTMYNYHVENLSANFNKAQTSWKEVKAQLEEVYALDISKSACKARTTRASNNVERWFKRVELLTARLPEGKKSSIVKLLTELGKELGKGPSTSESSRPCATPSPIFLSTKTRRGRSWNTCGLLATASPICRAT